MKRSRERILTTHAGSLPRPADLLEMVRALADGRPYDRDAYARRVKSAVGEIVRRQVELGVDVIDDGEMGKPSFVTYVIDRLSGFELSDKATSRRGRDRRSMSRSRSSTLPPSAKRPTRGRGASPAPAPSLIAGRRR